MRLVIGSFGRERFVEFGARFVADFVFGSGFQTQTTVARAIGEEFRRDAVNMLGAVASRLHTLNHAVFNFGVIQSRFE